MDLRLSLLEVSVPWQWQEAHTRLVSSLQKERKKRRQHWQPQPQRGASGGGEEVVVMGDQLYLILTSISHVCVLTLSVPQSANAIHAGIYS